MVIDFSMGFDSFGGTNKPILWALASTMVNARLAASLF
jgi:hypothetical protein